MSRLLVPCTLIVGAAFATPLFAADNVTVAKEKAMTSLYRVSTLESLKVHNRSGENLGKIKDLVVDARTGKISYAVLDFGGFLGIGAKWFAVPWHAFKYETINNEDRLVLDVSKERLKNAPGFDSSHWPNMADPAFSRDIDAFYGSEPTARR
jgi:sporulation protein YlmC with PRC-barrel domain